MPVIEVQGLHKRYGDTVAVDDVSLEIEDGEIFGILGPNGAGKTTLVECLVGLRRPDAGRVRVLGLDPQVDGRRVHEQVGVQLQESRLPEALRVREALELYASFYRDPADPDRLLRELGLHDKATTAFEDLSGGQQQRLSIALALVGNPRIAVLDELTTGLDPRARRDTWHLIEQVRASGVTVVLVTHLMDEAERLCDRLAVLDRGRVVAVDTPAGLVAGVQAGAQLRLRTVPPVDTAVLAGLGVVSEVRHEGEELVVTGDGDLLHAVVGAVHDAGAVVVRANLGQPSLEDAFVAITGRDQVPDELRDDAHDEVTA
ncbi:ABC transporter ATP-binding protein [Egicoccus halophilus]|uniref:Multidrug ABC transporter ATP-binding protein n=1 Tax=Egicoccus halophilus TaxID=1670830 RepID=A0A8J3ACY9_9ACTN|nr:ABC transporter ATP-binding protein [Egicoccus halophilus]GGI05524.1 multidrug ABC transporter ATP-binding protein [Egicoccus halophilus]